MFQFRRHLPTLAAAALLAGCAAPEAADGPTEGPAYGPSSIYRLAFQGIHLGMGFDDACRRLRSLGYVLRTVEEERLSCEDEAMLDEGSVTFFGLRPTVGLPPLPPDSPAATVRFFGLDTALRNGRREVAGIGIYTAEPNQRDALVERTMREWGRPTRYASHGYSELGYGLSARQVDGAHRHHFNSCWFRPQCARWQDRLDCGRILTEFSTAYANTIVYDWGRYIEMRDERDNPEVREILRRRAWEEDAACAIPTIH
jgi:hypothetical protein